MILIALATGGALAVHFMFAMPLGLSFFLFLVGWPVVGLAVTFDDDLPGGWSNPDGLARPQWKEPFFWFQVATGLVVSLAAFLIEAKWPAFVGTPWLVAVLALASYVFLIRIEGVASAKQEKSNAAQ